MLQFDNAYFESLWWVSALALAFIHYWGYQLYTLALQFGLAPFASRPSAATTVGQTYLRAFLIGLMTQCHHSGIRFVTTLVNGKLLSFSDASRIFIAFLFAPLIIWGALLLLPNQLWPYFVLLSALMKLIFPQDLLFRRLSEGLFGLALFFLAQWLMITFVAVDFFELLSSSFIKLWIFFFLLQILFRRSLVTILLISFFLAHDLWSGSASIAAISSTFFAVALVEQSLFKGSGDRGRIFIRLILLFISFLTLFDICFFVTSYYLAPSLLEEGSLSFLFFYFVLRLFFLLLFFEVAERLKAEGLYHWARKWARVSAIADRPDQFQVIGKASDMVPSLALNQVLHQLDALRADVDLMMKKVKDYIKNGPSARELAKIKSLEDATDRHYKDTLEYIQLIQTHALSPKQAHQVQVLLSIAYEMEKITDYLDKMATYTTDLKGEVFIDSEVEEDFWQLWQLVEQLYQNISLQLADSQVAMEQMDALSKQIKDGAQQFRLLVSEKTPPRGLAQNLLIISDMVMALRKVRGHMISISYKLREIS